jgi:hypothetical protein
VTQMFALLPPTKASGRYLPSRANSKLAASDRINVNSIRVSRCHKQPSGLVDTKSYREPRSAGSHPLVVWDRLEGNEQPKGIDLCFGSSEIPEIAFCVGFEAFFIPRRES